VKSKTIRRICIVYCVVLAMALVGIYYSSEYRECVIARGHGNNPSSLIDAPSTLVLCEANVLDKHNGLATAFATVVVAFFTIALVFATLRLWEAGEEQLRKTSESSERQLRAYVFLDSIDFETQINVDPALVNFIRPAIVWRNSGGTPAKNAVACHNHIVTQSPLADDFDFPDNKLKENFEIGPHASFTAKSIVVSIGAINHVVNNRYYFYIWGWVEYNDVFSKIRRRTEFSQQVLVHKLAGYQGTYIFSPISIGPFNGSDETCLRKPQALKA
jgi:hypothetical protein